MNRLWRRLDVTVTLIVQGSGRLPGHGVHANRYGGILAFAERSLPRASDLWLQASLDYKQRLQLLFFPEGTLRERRRVVRLAHRALGQISPVGTRCRDG